MKNPKLPADYARFHAYCAGPQEEPQALFARGAWSTGAEKGRRILIGLAARGLVRYVAEDFQYLGRLPDGSAWVMLGNPGPSAWEYLADHPTPEDW